MYAKLEEWKSSESKKALILLGARQTGKTYIVDEFARNNYPYYINVNFLEDEESGRFLANAKSGSELISRLSLIVGHEIQPKTLIFFDEVQHIGHDIVTLSKFLIDDNRFDVVLSGSLLGTALEGITSFPVGYAKILRMHPLDFEEFCWAIGVPNEVISAINESFEAKTPLEETLHDRLIKAYRQYIVVGGMPEAVQSFLDRNRDLGVARSVDSDIVEQYRYDIVKYSSNKKAQILSVFNNIPGQLAKENKRFELKTIQQSARYDRLQKDFAWLTAAGVALAANSVSEPKRPLLRTENPSRFKLYSLDSGILLSQYSLNSSMDIIDGSGDANYGAVYENVVAQELTASNYPLFYYANNRKGEVDFLIEDSNGSIIPIEVKSGKDYKRHLALNTMLGTKEYNIEKAYVLSEFNVSIEERAGKPVYYLPLYMTLCLTKESQTISPDRLQLPMISF